MFESLGDLQKLGLTGAIPILGFVLYQIYRLWKSDNKGDQVDARIQTYSATLQAQTDKLGVVIDQLRIENAGLIRENAKLDAQVTVLKAENEMLTKKISQQQGVTSVQS